MPCFLGQKLRLERNNFSEIEDGDRGHPEIEEAEIEQFRDTHNSGNWCEAGVPIAASSSRGPTNETVRSRTVLLLGCLC